MNSLVCQPACQGCLLSGRVFGGQHTPGERLAGFRGADERREDTAGVEGGHSRVDGPGRGATLAELRAEVAKLRAENAALWARLGGGK